MKKMIIICVAVCFILSSCSSETEIKFPSTQEYIVGQGNIQGEVDTAYFTVVDEAFAIGANEKGYAVFKNPEAAFQVLVEKYADGINLIQKSFELDALTQKNYKDYKIYGWQTTNGTWDELDQAFFISKFFDIYENSFE